jgi:hypothetical protein
VSVNFPVVVNLYLFVLALIIQSHVKIFEMGLFLTVRMHVLSRWGLMPPSMEAGQ